MEVAPGHVHSIQRKAKSRWIDAFFCFFWGLFDSTDGRRPLPISKKCFQHKSGLQLRTYIQLYQAIIAIDQSIALSIKTEEGLGLGFGPWLGPLRPRVRWSPWLGAEARPNNPISPISRPTIRTPRPSRPITSIVPAGSTCLSPQTRDGLALLGYASWMGPWAVCCERPTATRGGRSCVGLGLHRLGTSVDRGADWSRGRASRSIDPVSGHAVVVIDRICPASRALSEQAI